MKRGEIWWASLRQPMGSEPGYRRPVLVVQSDEFNKSSIQTAICAVITSNLNLAAVPGNIRLAARTSGLAKPSVVNISQILSVNRAQLTERVKSLDPQAMRQVEEGLRLVMSL